MKKRVVVIGAGMGGLTASIALSQRGFDVCVLEARSESGGLASACVFDGLRFDAGPYILLDRPGLEWAFASLGEDLNAHLELRRIDDIYDVASPGQPPVHFRASLEETAAGFERQWPGSGKKYERFIQRTARTYRALEPMLHASNPRIEILKRPGAWPHVPFLSKPLGAVLAESGLPEPIANAISIWTHVAGQSPQKAPSPLAFVPALIHTVGAFYPRNGIGEIPRVLVALAQRRGVEFRYQTRVRTLLCKNGKVCGVELATGQTLSADAVVSNYSGIGTHLEMLAETPAPVREKLAALPLQSPGVCAYLATADRASGPYLRFFLPGGDVLCRLLIRPEVVAPECRIGAEAPVRLLAPMRYDDAEAGGESGQARFLADVFAETWWRDSVGASRVLATRIPAEWGAQFNLYRQSMNPVMTAAFMRAGRLPHRSPHVRGLYLSGSSTHPGQWVSFCAISGILAAQRLQLDIE